MKTRFKLLMFVLVVVVAVLCVAACDIMGGGDGDTTTAPTTTEAPTTTAAPATDATTAPVVTTAPPAAGSIFPALANVQLNVSAEGTTYTGSALTKKGYAVVGANLGSGKVTQKIEFLALDPESLEPLTGAAATTTVPTDAGTYRITVSFTWSAMASQADQDTYTLPAPISKTWVVHPKTLDAAGLKYGAYDYETFYYEGMQFDVAAETSEDLLINGTPDKGLSRVLSLAKLDAADDTTPEAMTGTVITEGGYYQLIVSYVEPAGKQNFANEDAIKHTSVIFIRDLSDARYQVKKVDAGEITIDGAIEEAYMHTASIASTYQAPYTGDNAAAIVNPYEYVGMTKISNPGNIAVPADTAVTLRVLWGEETVGTETVPYLYVIVDVTDTTPFARSAKYTAHRNAWINDSVEFTYKLGGHSVPVIADTDPDTYPVYSTVLVDGREKSVTENGHTAVFAQQSVYFDDVKSATARKANGYIVELKIPAKSESYEGLYGGADFVKTEGEALEVGEFIFLCFQLNDLTALPAGYTSAEEYDAQIDSFTTEKYKDKWSTAPQGEWVEFESAAQQFVYCSGNRNKAYLTTPGAGPAVFQLSDLTWQE